MTIAYSARQRLYNLQIPPAASGHFHIDLTAVGSDVRMLELLLQPPNNARGNGGQTVYTWDYKGCFSDGRSRSTFWGLRRLIAWANSRGWARRVW